MGKSERQKIFEQKALQKKEERLAKEQQKLSRMRRQKIKMLVLEKLETELQNATPTDVDNILARSDIRFDSEFIETEETEEVESDYEAEPKTCYFSNLSSHHATWHTQGIEKFDLLLTEAARENSTGSFSAKFALKIRTRYDSLLKFLTSADYTYCSAEISCTSKD